MNDKKKIEVEDEKQRILEKYSLDRDSVLNFQKQIKICSKEEALRGGQRICDILTQKYVEAISEKELKRLILEGADVNYQDAFGNTPLMYAPATNYIVLFLRSGANVNIANNSNQTSLFVAAKNGNVEGCLLQILFGANVNHLDNNGETALFSILKDCKTSIDLFEKFIKEKRIEILKLLVEYGAYLNVVNINGENIFSFAKYDLERKYLRTSISDTTLRENTDVDFLIKDELMQAKKKIKELKIQ